MSSTRRSTGDTAPIVVPTKVGCHRHITYYAPWGNPAIFYNDLGCTAGPVELGAIESGIDQLAGIEDDSDVTIELAD